MPARRDFALALLSAATLTPTWVVVVIALMVLTNLLSLFVYRLFRLWVIEIHGSLYVPDGYWVQR